MMQASKISSALSTLIDLQTPICLWGASGIGKSSILKQVAIEKEIEFFHYNLSLMDSFDADMLALLPEDKQGILYLEGIDLASQRVQAFVYQLMLDAPMQKHRLPDGWMIISSGTRQMDKDELYKIPLYVANRFVHLQMEADVNDWKTWAFQSGIDERVIAYISYKQEELLDATPYENAFATPRSWESVSKILRSGMDEKLLFDVLSGAIGKERTGSFLSFAEVVYKLPDIESILSTGEGEYSDEADVLHALSSVLVSFLLKYRNEENIDNVLKYVLGLQSEFSVMIVQDLRRTGLSIEHLESFNVWVKKFSYLMK